MSLIYNMIVFLESDKNDFTIDFNPPIRASKVRLVSCSLFNSWYNLIGARIPKVGAPGSHTIPDSHYTPITLAKELAKAGYTLTLGLPHEMKISFPKSDPSSNMEEYMIFKNGPHYILRQFLGLPTVYSQGYNTVGEVVKWPVPNAYEVHCSLVRTYDNGSISNIMSKFTPKGNPFDLVEYMPIALTYELSSDLVESIHICIKVDGEVVNFNDRKINLVLEFI